MKQREFIEKTDGYLIWTSNYSSILRLIGILELENQ